MREGKRGDGHDRAATADELLGAILALAVILIPIVLLVLLPDNEVVMLALGNGRVFLLWAIVFPLAWVFRKKIDRFLSVYLSTTKNNQHK